MTRTLAVVAAILAVWLGLGTASAASAEVPTTGTEMARSEDLVAQVYPRWLRHGGHLPGSHYVQQEPPPTQLSAADLGRLFVRLDQGAEQWSAVEVGDAMTVRWAWAERA